MNLARSHPNATAAAGFTGPAVVVAWALGALGLDIPAPVAAAIAGGIVSAGLLVGRRGIRGVARLLWRGSSG